MCNSTSSSQSAIKEYLFTNKIIVIIVVLEGDDDDESDDFCLEKLNLEFECLREITRAIIQKVIEEFTAQLVDIWDKYGALLIVDYKMKILPKSARETKSKFFGKRGWSLHSILIYTKDPETNNLDIQTYDHWSNDTKQDAWFTASSLHSVIEILEKKPRWITIISDNEAGEAKTIIDSHHAQFTAQLVDIWDKYGALLIVDYKMKILPKSARETKSKFFGKRGWSLHSILIYTKDPETNNLDIQTYDHWSNDTKQDAWFTASSLHSVIEILEKKPRWITIISDNEAGEAKTIIDSHHAQITHAIKRYVKLGHDITSGEDIEDAIKGLAGTHVVHIQPDHLQNQNINKKLGTIPGITNWAEWTWPNDENDIGYIYGRALPGFGTWNKFSPYQIQKISKERIFVKPNPMISQHTKPNKLWTTSIIEKKDNAENNELEIEIMNLLDRSLMDIIPESKSHKIFYKGWALKENQKNRMSIKRIIPEIKALLECMFHTGTANPRQKMSAQEMCEELLQRENRGEINIEDIPKESTIANWITTFSRKWKQSMALRNIEEAKKE
ncbi:hypothetical protein Glove_194g125 [Diversispora epigaea]|uniref:Uncharacterized protein n=1 Tax=Diversispora epigaea TaxID=1348612 RepID=A0A397IPC2_9GLOM|nr:hypothetical protein Glove_194g125 [Diversispora epigaea]